MREPVAVCPRRRGPCEGARAGRGIRYEVESQSRSGMSAEREARKTFLSGWRLLLSDFLEGIVGVVDDNLSYSLLVIKVLCNSI